MKMRITIDENSNLEITEFTMGGVTNTLIPRDASNKTFRIFGSSKYGEILENFLIEWSNFLPALHQLQEEREEKLQEEREEKVK